MNTQATMSRMRGYTLMELMIVVAVIGVLAALAMSGWGNYAYRAHRVDGQNMLQHISTAQERYYSTFNNYTADLTKFGYSKANSAPSEKQYYEATVVLGGAGQSYTATVKPVGAQVDDKCGSLTQTNTGVKSYSGKESNGKCW